MSRSTQRFLQPKMLSQLATMELRAQTVVEGFLSGLHRSPFRGFSMEFAEYRQYQPGDELSKVDWKAYARSDRFYIKEFEDETNLDACLVLDSSASMGFQSDGLSKWQYSGILAASLAYLLHKQNDNVGLAVLDEKIRLQLPAKGTRGHLMHLIGELEKIKPERKTSLSSSLHALAASLRRRGLIVIISDLLDDEEAFINSLRHLQFSGSEIMVFHVLDSAELHFPFEGPTLFLEPEAGQVTPSLAEDVKTEYLKNLQTFIDRISEELGRTNISYTLLDTGEPLDRALLSFLTRRRSLARH